LGIPIESLKEGCCKSIEDYTVLVTDDNRNDKNIKFVDYVIDLDDKYLFIEEKSFTLGILPPRNGEISDEVIEKFKALSPLEKELKICKTSFRLISDSSQKLKDTLLYLYKEFYDLDKIKKSPFIYLYCKSGLREVDRILITSLSMKNRKNTFLSCDRLDAFISKIKDN
jgi:hypothetical protein